MKSCASTVLTVIFLAGLVIWAIASCNASKQREQAAEADRRAALTPEQRTAEDDAAAAARAKKEQDERDDQMKDEARQAAKEYVLKYLKHPDDASIGSFLEIPTVRANADLTLFTVDSTVKAKNDFGAAFTYPWQAILRLDGNTFSLVACTIGNDVVYTNGAAVAEIGEQAKARAAAEVAAQAAQEKREHVEELRAKAAEIEKRKWRTWTTADGKHSADAKFDGLTAGVVKLLKRDGSSARIPLEKLSDLDREFIAKRQWEQEPDAK